MLAHAAGQSAVPRPLCGHHRAQVDTGARPVRRRQVHEHVARVAHAQLPRAQGRRDNRHVRELAAPERDPPAPLCRARRRHTHQSAARCRDGRCRCGRRRLLCCCC